VTTAPLPLAAVAPAAPAAAVTPAPAPRVSASVLERIEITHLLLREHHPFFEALFLMAPLELTDSLPTAATDGERLYFNPAFVERLSYGALAGLVVHELLHCALLHVPRRGERDRLLWNIAADIHVNGVIRGLRHLELPEGGVEEPKLAHLPVEEIYEKLLTSTNTKRALGLVDLLDVPATDDGSLRDAIDRLGTFWGDAVERARAVALSARAGTMPAGIDRLINEVHSPGLDWQSMLWRFMVRTPDDFVGFDRRFYWQGLYIDSLDGESVDVDVCVDTSGSVDDGQLRTFLAEVRGILNAYPTVRCRLYYCDAACTGPFNVHADRALPVATGGGGTNFAPFFSATAVPHGERSTGPRVAIYLTDGYGFFPKVAPDRPVLWVVTPGGQAAKEFPFGEVVRMGVRR